MSIFKNILRENFLDKFVEKTFYMIYRVIWSSYEEIEAKKTTTKKTVSYRRLRETFHKDL